MSTMGGLTITTDCRVPVGQLYTSPGMYGGPHTCTAANPCDARVTVTEFLQARVAEKEAAAQGAGVIAWLTYRRPDGSMDHTELASATVDAPDVWVTAEGEAAGFTSAQVVYDERRVLAECEAKRNIVEHQAQIARTSVGLEGRAAAHDRGLISGLTFALLYLAAPYADHPDYLPEWNQSVENERSQVQPATSSAPPE